MKEIEHIVLVEKGGRSRRTSDFKRIEGYLDSFVDRGLFYDRIVKTEIWKSEDFDLSFYGDKELKEKVLSLEDLPERYLVIKAEIVDRNEIGEKIRGFCDRFDFQYFFHNTVQKGGDE